MTRDRIRFLRRGRIVEAKGFSPTTTLLDWLRLQDRATGTKEACAEGDCGACTVVLARPHDDGVAYAPVNACITLLGQIDGTELVTVEDLARDGALHPIQSALAGSHGTQCGFCTPGIVMSLFAFAHRGTTERRAGRADIDEVLAGNLCRCTGYRPIVEAALEACATPIEDAFTRSEAARAAALAALQDGADVFVGDATSFFAAPASEDTLAGLLAAHPDATLVAGATDVGLWVTKRLSLLPKVVHLGRIVGFAGVEETASAFVIGAGTPLAAAAPTLAAIDPDIDEIFRRFGSTQVRSAGTVGGNIANGSPIGDLAPVLIALGATMELRRGDHVRTIAVEDFFLAYGKQDRAVGEFVRRLIIPKPGPKTRVRALKVTKRRDEDISAVMMALAVTIEDGRIADARIAFGGMAGTPKRARAVEAAAVGGAIADPAVWRAAAARIGEDFTPLTDQRGSASYRLRVAGNLIIKALAEIAGAPDTATRVAPRRDPSRREVDLVAH